MRKGFNNHKCIALFYLVIFSINTFAPTFVYALTSGPTQPETSSFQPIGTNDMVDLFTGDFRYNIPLLDVGGYPLNLSYQSGSTMDDEASWVGFGWTLNPGAVNRQMRGLPDDFRGDGNNPDLLQKTVNMKPQITKGIALSTNNVTKSYGFPKTSHYALNDYSIGFAYSNYSGIKATLSANAKIGASLSIGTSKTASLGLASINITTDNQNGASFGGNLNLAGKFKTDELNFKTKSASFQFSYNSNAGLSELTLSPILKNSGSKFLQSIRTNQSGNQDNPGISFVSNDYVAPVEAITIDKSTTFTLSLGIQKFGPGKFNGILKVPGYYNKIYIPEDKIVRNIPAYGMLYAEQGKHDDNALGDFNRENDRPYMKTMPNLPVPIATPDLFNVSSQGYSGQFKLSTNGSGIFANNNQSDQVLNFGLGLEIGIPGLPLPVVNYQIGIPGLGISYNENSSGKWRNRNDYQDIGDFKKPASPLPTSYFKKVGGLVANDNSYYNAIGGQEALKVNLHKNFLTPLFGTGQSNAELNSNSGQSYQQNLAKTNIERQGTLFNYLTAAEAQNGGLDRQIKNFTPNSSSPASLILDNINSGLIANIDRVSVGGYRKPHHISEINVTDNSGSRQVYGIPVYNVTQQDYSFSILANESERQAGYTQYQPLDDIVATGNSSKLKEKHYQYYYSKQVIPAYATSYLLTGMLSPDYVDVKNDGITDDDLGTAVKFNYSIMPYLYHWRTPNVKKDHPAIDGTKERSANYSEGFLSDTRDDKATFSYGEKELWYMHSIESKNVVAYFILNNETTSPRRDGLGVVDVNGTLDKSHRQRYLKEIRLYSKSDILKNSSNLNLVKPIKTVHFEYSYELFSGLPNSEYFTKPAGSNVPDNSSGGKLTLKKVWFTFGENGKGALNPYEFEYNIPPAADQKYGLRKYDRWGNYKPTTGYSGSLNNSEFPYSTQIKGDADLYAGFWQMRKIILPSGGHMEVAYESDDYAYVQNKRASSMYFLSGIGGTNNTEDINSGNKDKFYISVPFRDPGTDINIYFEGMEYLYYKAFVDLDNKGAKEYIPGYARILDKRWDPNSSTSKIIEVTVEKNNDANPISKSGWQLMRSSLQRLAYPESDNLESDDNSFVSAIKALISSIGRLKDLIENFDQRAARKNFATKFDPAKSWVRLCNPYMKKLGGGSRVQKITINDQWSEMTNVAISSNTVQSATYGQNYYYTTANPNNPSGPEISSGVASYEPLLGNDENPFRQPVKYSQGRTWGLDNQYYLEEPLGESYFPGPMVGYSKVTVKNIGADALEGNTGSTTSEFYTAKDFPTILQQTPLDAQLPKLSNAIKLFGFTSYDQVTLSQGYLVINNDMHGKPKGEEILDKAGQQISAVKYIYKTQGNAGDQKLQTTAMVMRTNGSLDQSMVGSDVDFYTDMSEHKTESVGINGEPAFGMSGLSPFAMPWFYWGGFKPNWSKKIYRAAVAIKTIHQSGILEKVIKIEKGSKIESENLVWDAETGEVLLTKTQNEFDDPIYSFNYPAHWKYQRMGPGYKNQGLYLDAFSSDVSGVITNTAYNSYLYPGDELIDVTPASGLSDNKYWVIQDNNGFKRIADKDGQIVQLTNTTVKILRSGCRNMSSASVGTVVSLINPITGNQLNLSIAKKVLNASAAEYSEEWYMPLRLKCNPNCPAGYSENGQECQSITTSSPNNCYNFPFCQDQDYRYSWHTNLYEDNADYQNLINYTYTQLNNSNDFYWHNNIVSPILSHHLGPLNRCGIRFCNQYINQWVGTSTIFNAQANKEYFIGLGGDDKVMLKINGNKIVLLDNEPWKIWRVFPYKNFKNGVNTIEIYYYNDDDHNGNANNPASMGCEIYENTRNQLLVSNGSNPPNIVFTTLNLIGLLSPVGYPFWPPLANPPHCEPCNVGVYDVSNNNCVKVDNIPFTPQPTYFNPYVTGILGNWRAKNQYVYDEKRLNFPGNNNLSNPTDIRHTGYYTSFQPYWVFSNDALTKNSGADQWKSPNTVSLINTKGQEIENVNALTQYSAAVFGYGETFPTAVASNAQHQEIAYDGFEDYNFRVTGNSEDCYALPPHFGFNKLLSNAVVLSKDYAHSGNYSLKLTGSVELTKDLIARPTGNVYSFNSLGQYTAPGTFETYKDYMKGGFMPIPGKNYVLSLWVKDNGFQNQSNLTIQLLNQLNTPFVFPIAGKKWPVVEGWKRIEIPFLMDPSWTNFDLKIVPGGTTYIDDIRIFPADAQMKSFVYDETTQKLMAELDENNFTTFYEYNNEGSLVRVKKETEKGIMTIKETRSHYKAH